MVGIKPLIIWEVQLKMAIKPRILILADINSPHTQKWVDSLLKDNFKIGIFSFNSCNSNKYKYEINMTVLHQAKSFSNMTFLSKISYFFLFPKLLVSIIKFKPNVIHAHYASSYGLIGALTFFKPFIVSAWGSDVMVFPKKNFLKKKILHFVLWRADKICVTSSILKEEVKKYTSKKVFIIPFGVNLNLFYSKRNEDHSKDFVFGCTKFLEKIYNIDRVVLAFNLLVKKYPNTSLKLKLVGNGSEQQNIESLINLHNLNSRIEMVGRVSHDKIPDYLNSLDVLVNVSEIESFGVCVAEAMACEIPVIVSNSSGFKDLIPNQTVGLITKSTSVDDIFVAMETYLLNNELRFFHAKNAHERINLLFNWKNSVSKMEELYLDYL